MPRAWTQLSSLAGLDRSIRLVWSAGPAWILASLAVAAVLGLLPLGSLLLHKQIIDAIVAPGSPAEPVVRTVMTLIGILGLLELCALAGRLLGNHLSEHHGLAVQDHVTRLVHDKSIELDLSFYENPSFQNTLHRTQMLAPQRAAGLVGQVTQILRAGISLIAVMFFLLTFHWAVAISLVVAVLPGLFARLQSADRLVDFQKASTERERLAWYYHSMNTLAQSAKEIRIFDLGRLFRDRHQSLRDGIRKEKLSLSRNRLGIEMLVQGGATIAQFAGYGFVAFQTLQGRFSIGELVMFYQAFLRAQGYLQQMMQSVGSLYETKLIMDHLFDLLQIRPRIVSPVKPEPLPSPPDSTLEIQGLSFTYPDSRRTALHDIDLVIRPGEHLGIVGSNGSGKTTLVKLLCRLHEPTQGTISLGGRSIAQFDLREYRRQFSVLFQDYLQHPLNARENIWLGDSDLPKDAPALEAVARLTGAHDVIQRLPQGWDTTLGRRFTGGEELSQGEWQKLALARALLPSSRVIILDEPTSSMDPEAEYQIFRRFHEITRDRTAILISHRLNTVRMADRILVLDQGRIVECGTHDELVKRGQHYAHLFETQATHYR